MYSDKDPVQPLLKIFYERLFPAEDFFTCVHSWGRPCLNKNQEGHTKVSLARLPAQAVGSHTATAMQLTEMRLSSKYVLPAAAHRARVWFLTPVPKTAPRVLFHPGERRVCSLPVLQGR